MGSQAESAQANVALVRESVEAFNAGDMAKLLAVAAPDIGEQRVGVLDGAFTAFDRDIHGSALPRHAHRARQGRHPIARHQQKIDAAGKQRAVGGASFGKIIG